MNVSNVSTNLYADINIDTISYLISRSLPQYITITIYYHQNMYIIL